MQKPTLKLYVREWREARQMTQQQLADAIGRDKSVVSKLERGLSGITSATMNSIGDALGVDPQALHEPPPEGTRAIRPGEAGQVGSVHVNKEEREATIDALERQIRLERHKTMLAREQAIRSTQRVDPVKGSPFVPWDFPEKLVSDQADLPIYTSAQGGSTGMIVSYDPIEYVKRPEPLFNVSKGFGMYVVGDSMEPAYRQGDMILVHPKKPPNPGDDVLILIRNGTDEYEALVKTLVKTEPDNLLLKQYNPSQEFRLARKDVHEIFLIVGKYNRR